MAEDIPDKIKDEAKVLSNKVELKDETMSAIEEIIKDVVIKQMGWCIINMCFHLLHKKIQYKRMTQPEMIKEPLFVTKKISLEKEKEYE
jgi:hypothetical protein